MGWLKQWFNRAPRLVYVDPISGKQRTYTIEQNRVSIGRAPDNDIILLDGEQKISRHHAALVKEDGIWSVQDLQSTYGITVNDQKVIGARPIADGGKILIVKTLLTFHAPGYEVTEANLSETIVEAKPERQTRIKQREELPRRQTRLKPIQPDDDEDLRDTLIGGKDG